MKNRLALAAVLTITLGGCGTLGATGNNTSMYSTNQPVVSRTNYAIDVNLDGGDGIAQTDKERVSEWFDALDLGFGDRIAIDYGTNPRSNVVRSDVEKLASVHGMEIVDAAPVTAGLVAPGSARIVVTRSEATVPDCPNWSKTTEANFNSSNHPNYGCAVNSNMAAMVADPEDLVRGRESKINREISAGRPSKSKIGGN